MAVDYREASDPQISPNGSRVAFVVSPKGHLETNPATAIFVAPTDGSSSPVPLTGNEHHNHQPRWSPDGETIAFLSDSVERGTLQAFRVPAGGGEPFRLTNLPGGISNLSWSHDGAYLYFTARRADVQGETQSKSDIYVASEQAKPRTLARVAASGGVPTDLGPETGHVASYAESPVANEFAMFVTPDNTLDGSWDRARLFVKGQGDAREFGAFRSSPEISWSPDGRQLSFINAGVQDHMYPCVTTVDVSSGTITFHDDGGMSPYQTKFVGNRLLIHAVEGQRTRLYWSDATGEELEPVSTDPVLQERWIVPEVSAPPDGHALAITAAKSDRPADVFVMSRAGKASQLSNLNPHLDDVEFAEMQEVTWSGEDGQKIYGWLLLPPGRTENGPLPLVVNVHGGPSMAWGNWFHAHWHDWGQNLAAAGFAVLLPNPRGSKGQGAAFESLNRNDLGGEDYQDVLRGVDMLVDRKIADPDRIGIGGWSYGGFLTAWAVGQTDRFKAAVAGAAVTNWPSKVGTTDIRPANEFNFETTMNENPDRLWERSPVRYLGNITTPTLVVHGQADVRVPVSQGMEFYLGLRDQGVACDFVTYPRQGHGFHERAFQLDLLKRVVAWFEMHLKP